MIPVLVVIWTLLSVIAVGWVLVYGKRTIKDTPRYVAVLVLAFSTYIGAMYTLGNTNLGPGQSVVTVKPVVPGPTCKAYPVIRK